MTVLMVRHEIDELLADSIALIRRSAMSEPERARLIGNLERLPGQMAFDASGAGQWLPNSELLPVFALGLAVMREAGARQQRGLIYDWCALLLNFWERTPHARQDPSGADVRRYFPAMRRLLRGQDFEGHRPRHRSLTLHPDGSGCFSAEQNALIRRFFAFDCS